MNKDFTYLFDFINEIDVVCINCRAKAKVISNPKNQPETRFTCLDCGANKIWKEKAGILWSNRMEDREYEGMLFGQPIDCFFKMDLWYQTSVKENVLYGFNLDHLEFIKSYVQDEIRERKQNEFGWSNQSLESRLPKWILSAKNRNLVGKKLNELMLK